MAHLPVRHFRLVDAMLGLVAFTLASQPVLAATDQTPRSTDCSAIQFDLAVPGPGSNVTVGRNLVQGIATDNRSVDGTGIDRIDFYLENRDLGGTRIGTAVPVSGPAGSGSFQAIVSFPNRIGGHDFFAYAHSSVTGQESVIQVPFVLGDPDQASPAWLTATRTCSGSSSSALPPASVAQVTSANEPATTMQAVSAQPVQLQVGNPSSGDNVKVGATVFVQGAAFDQSAQSGSGIDRIEIFLGNRDEGGMLLGRVTPSSSSWQALVKLPPNREGLQTLFVYAHSAATDQVAASSILINTID